MEFIKYPLPPMGAAKNSSEILKTRRIELRLTQQQVADGAKVQLQQYQRLETGERNIESASMRIALSICAVLKLDPFVFFPECYTMNKYSDTVKREEEPIIKESAIPAIVAEVCEMYNERFQTSYSLDNIKLAFCTLTDITSVYDTFTKQHGFHSEKRTIEDFEFTLAETFVGQTDCNDPKHVDGILIRTDPPKDLDNYEYYKMMIVHEIAHIFCITHEIDSADKAGQRFYDRYCAGTPKDFSETFYDGQINAGYAIWREFIADIVQDIVYQQPAKRLKVIAPMLRALAKEVKVGSTSSKSAMHRYLSEVINSYEGSEAEEWSDLESKLKALKLPFVRIVEHVFTMLHDGSCIAIDPESIQALGTMYMADMIQNTPQSEIIKFAESYGYKFS